MSKPEARVHLELEKRQVPFSWRFFDGDAPTLKMLMPDFSPEFTMREYKLVILIIGEFWGTLPAVIDKNALGQALLEEDGWKVVSMTEPEIMGDLDRTWATKLPELMAPAVKGEPRPNPYGLPDFMARRRLQLKGQGLLRQKFGITDQDKEIRRGRRRRPRTFVVSARQRLRGGN